jgi:hypothetical protein
MSSTSQPIHESYLGQIPDQVVKQPSRRLRRDDLFFSVMAILILATVFLGFARTYYLAGMYHAHVRSLLIHIHGAVFSAWIVLFVVQTSLIVSRHVAWHRRLGFLGAFLAVLMVTLGVLAATDSLSRGFAPPGSNLDPKTFYAIPIAQIITFAVLIVAAIRVRSDGPAHKRLVLLATIALMGPAINRWPFAFVTHPPVMTNLLLDAMVLLVVAFDLGSQGRIHRVTIKGGLFLVFSQHLMFPFGLTPVWHKLAGLAQAGWSRLQ